MARKAAAAVDEAAKPSSPAEELPAVAQDIEIEIEVPEAESVIDTAPATPEPVPSRQPEPVPVTPAPAEDSEKIALRQRLAEMQQAEEINRQQLQEAQRGQQQSRRQAWDAQYDAIVNSMGAAQSEYEAADAAYEVAEANGDVQAKRDSRKRAIRAEAMLVDLERRKDWMDNQAETWKRQQQQPRRQQQPQPQQRQLTIEEIITNSALPDRGKSWLRQHPEYITDQAKGAEINSLHRVAVRQAGSEWTDAYFERMEDLLGLKPAAVQSNGA